jgi:hypothetical protein
VDPRSPSWRRLRSSSVGSTELPVSVASTDVPERWPVKAFPDGVPVTARKRQGESSDPDRSGEAGAVPRPGSR